LQRTFNQEEVHQVVKEVSNAKAPYPGREEASLPAEAWPQMGLEHAARGPLPGVAVGSPLEQLHQWGMRW
jgi:hypothetical protein